MIKILITSDQSDNFVSLVSKGHADSAPYGEDLVCAAVSAVILGGINALNGKFDLDTNQEKGMIKLVRKNECDNHDKIVIETIVKQLKAISLAYPKNLTVEAIKL